MGRPETGPMRFGDDWPGVFIRGDNALAYAHNLALALGEMKGDRIRVAILGGLQRTLASCAVSEHGPEDLQKVPALDDPVRRFLDHPRFRALRGPDEFRRSHWAQYFLYDNDLRHFATADGATREEACEKALKALGVE